MTRYNPHSPIVIGNEWVPIYSGQRTPDTLTEYGTTFKLQTSLTVVTGGVYVPPQYPFQEMAGDRTYLNMNVYPKGLEDLTGPVEQLIYLPQSGTVSGDFSVNGSCTVPQALLATGSCNIIATISTPSSNSGELDLFFDINAFDELDGKRILKFELLYRLTVFDPTVEDRTFPGRIFISTTTKDVDMGFITDSSGLTEPNVVELDLGEWNVDFPEDAQQFGLASDFIYPWTPDQLNRFDGTTASESRMRIRFRAADVDLSVHYVAVRVTYCEERRVAVGATRLRLANSPNPRFIKLLNPTTLANATLGAGEYTVTSNAIQMPSPRTGGAPQTPFTRQLYEVSDNQGVIIRRRYTPGEMFTKETTDIMPQLSLHTAAQAVTGVHGYGAQLAGKVYGDEVVAQDIRNPGPGVLGLTTPVSMTQVRFYARRYPSTTKSLTIQPSGQTTPYAVISPAEFDELPEIWDGWKEVTLRLSTAIPYQVTGGAQIWSWRAADADVGSRWEILMANADTSTPESPPGSDPLAIDVTTYGSYLQRGWHDGAWDFFVDAVLMFSGDPAVPENFAVAEVEQELVGVDPTCPGVDADCIPSAIRYHQLTWDETGLTDEFDRTATDQWGTTTSGQDWEVVAGTAANFDVANDAGTIALPTADATQFVVGETLMYDTEMYFRFSLNQAPTGNEVRVGVAFRYIDVNNHYEIQVACNTDQTIDVSAFKKVAGTVIGIGTQNVDAELTFLPDTIYGVRVQAINDSIRVKVWRENFQDEPSNWLINVVDTWDPWAGRAGFRVRSAVSNTNNGLIASFYEVKISDLDSGGYELQRQDDYDDDWQTIMRTTSSHVAAFNDYEARVGVQSRYRLRKANAMEFWSDWTDTAFNTLSAPGVDVPGDGNSVLILTTNFVQDGDSNLASTMVWSGDPEEPFGFLESGEVEFSKLYGRNFQLASHPSERGGEQFTRSLLVQQAAIPLPSLGNFRSLRDLAWLSAPYVCVRDELGNRWFANVQVPDGVVRRNRRLYIASLTITEVTDTPAIIDPEA